MRRYNCSNTLNAMRLQNPIGLNWKPKSDTMSLACAAPIRADSREVLDIAYRRAVAANPQYDSEKKAEAKRAADAAKKAASLNVKSGGSSVFMKAAKGDVYAGMYEIYDRMNGGGRT